MHIVVNMRQFCIEHNLNPSAMSAVARGKKRMYKNYQCKKISNNKNVEYNYQEWKPKPRIGLSGKRNSQSKPVIINCVEYQSIREASKETGLSLHMIRKYYL